MPFRDILEKDRPTISLEFFPPKTLEGWERLFRVIRELADPTPDFVSITYGAGGSTREHTYDLVKRIVTDTSLTVVAHLTCICDSLEEVDGILNQYARIKVPGIMALAGDPPVAEEGGCYDVFEHASDLVRHIRSYNVAHRDESWGGFDVGVAGFPEGHPGTPNRVAEMEFLKQKVDAGADYICTQLFFDNHDFYDFRERCVLAGINVPIIAGLMPIVSRSNFDRIPTLALGTRFPADLIRRIDSASDQDIWKVGVGWAVEQSTDLLSNDVRGIHYYTLNRSQSVRSVWEGVREAL